MSGKKIQIGAKPTNTAAATVAADDWVQNRDTAPIEKEPMKRLTIDIPESLHRAIKMHCVESGTSIADEVRALLIQKFVNQ